MTLSQRAPHGGRKASLRPVSAGILYFANVFAVGFVLGMIRTFLLEPRVGPDVKADAVAGGVQPKAANRRMQVKDQAHLVLPRPSHVLVHPRQEVFR